MCNPNISTSYGSARVQGNNLQEPHRSGHRRLQRAHEPRDVARILEATVDYRAGFSMIHYVFPFLADFLRLHAGVVSRDHSPRAWHEDPLFFEVYRRDSLQTVHEARAVPRILERVVDHRAMFSMIQYVFPSVLCGLLLTGRGSFAIHLSRAGHRSRSFFLSCTGAIACSQHTRCELSRGFLRGPSTTGRVSPWSIS